MYQIMTISLSSLPGKARKSESPKAALLETLESLPIGSGFFVNAIDGEDFTKTSRRVTSAISQVRIASNKAKDFAPRVCDGTGAHVEAFRAALNDDDSKYKARCAAAAAAHEEACKAAKKAGKPEPDYVKPLRIVQGQGILVSRIK